MRLFAKAAVEKAHKAFAAYMEEVGAVRQPDSSSYRWKAATELGNVWLSLHDGDFSIYVRFDDVDRAKAYLGDIRLNPFSGKWNWHGLTNRDNPFDAFKTEFDAVIALKAGAIVGQ